MTLTIPTIISTTLMDEQRHRNNSNVQNPAYLGNRRAFSEQDLEHVGSFYREEMTIWNWLKIITHFAEAEMHENGSSWDKEMKRPGMRNYSGYANEQRLHPVSNKQLYFVKTEITQTSQDLKNDRNRLESS